MFFYMRSIEEVGRERFFCEFMLFGVVFLKNKDIIYGSPSPRSFLSSLGKTLHEREGFCKSVVNFVRQNMGYTERRYIA